MKKPLHLSRWALALILVICASMTLELSVGPVAAANCSGTSVPGLVPTNDLGNSTYQGYPGGLYPNSSNTMPQTHFNDGFALSGQITPRDSNGNLSLTGKIVLVTIGMSNTNIESQGLIQLAQSASLNPALVIVNGAQGGEDAKVIVTNPSPYWSYVNTQLSNAGVTAHQVQAAWLKEADAGPSGSSISYAQTLASQLIIILQMMTQQFPNLKLTYLSSRIYAGYASSTLNPEPYAYTSGFSVKWVVEAQINGTSSLNYKPSMGPVVSPWVSWGPYIWANGLTPRSDGLTWVCPDFQSDGTHPSIPQGQLKVGKMLLDFFRTDQTSTPWFLPAGTVVGGGGGFSYAHKL